MYQAEIIDKRIVKGLLSVDVSFSNGADTVLETFQTNQSQPESWIGDQIDRKLKNLNSLSGLKDSIPIGAFQASEPPAKSEAKIYQEKRDLYINYMNEARMGTIQYDRPIIVELKEWLTANFKDEYL